MTGSKSAAAADRRSPSQLALVDDKGAEIDVDRKMGGKQKKFFNAANVRNAIEMVERKTKTCCRAIGVR